MQPRWSQCAFRGTGGGRSITSRSYVLQEGGGVEKKKSAVPPERKTALPPPPLG